MKFIFTEVKEFDVEAEYKRIEACFKDRPRLRKKLEKIVKLFCDEKFQECLDVINTLGRDKELECSQKEFIGLFVSHSIRDLCYTPNLTIRKA